MIQNIFDNPAVLRVGWALLHFLWQGTVIALALKATLMVVKQSSSRLRYALALVSLFLMAASPVFVLCKPQGNNSYIPSVHESIRSETVSAPNSTTPSIPVWNKTYFRDRVFRFVTPSVPWIAAGWCLGMALLLVKTIGGIIQVRHLKRNAAAYCGIKGIDSFHQLAAWAKVDGVPVLKSSLVSAPTVAGWFKPVVLLPEGVLGKIDRTMLDSLVAHEFAHIRRRDSVINLFQTIIENMFFFHPAVWWVSMRVRAEREACCDDDAVAICGNMAVYVRALSQAEQFRSSMPVIALSSSPLLQRIRRLTEMKMTKSGRSTAFSIALLAVFFIVATAAGSVVLATIPPQDSRSNVSADTQGGDRDSDKDKPETQEAGPAPRILKASMLQTGIDVQSPGSGNAADVNSEARIILSINREGLIFHGSKEINISSLPEQLKKDGVNPNDPIFLRADEDVKWNNIMSVIDAIRGAGFSRIQLVTTPFKDSGKRREKEKKITGRKILVLPPQQPKPVKDKKRGIVGGVVGGVPGDVTGGKAIRIPVPPPPPPVKDKTGGVMGGIVGGVPGGVVGGKAIRKPVPPPPPPLPKPEKGKEGSMKIDVPGSVVGGKAIRKPVPPPPPPLPEKGKEDSIKIDVPGSVVGGKAIEIPVPPPPQPEPDKDE